MYVPDVVAPGAEESFPFSVSGGLRRRLAKLEIATSISSPIERFNYLQLRGSSQQNVPLKREPSIATQEAPQNTAPRVVSPIPVPTFAPTEPKPQIPIAAEPAVLETPITQVPTKFAKDPIVKLETPQIATPVIPSLLVQPQIQKAPKVPEAPVLVREVTPLAKVVVAEVAHEVSKIQMPSWNTIVQKQPHSGPVDWSVVKSGPTPITEVEETNIELKGAVRAEPTAEAVALEELKGSNIHSILMNAALYATLITALFGILTALTVHR